jgi:hypothetical protein
LAYFICRNRQKSRSPNAFFEPNAFFYLPKSSKKPFPERFF